MQDASETMKALEAAVMEARMFFGIDPIWDTPLVYDHDSGAAITADPAYLRGPIRVELDYFQRNPGEIREYMAHEVAHILSAELTRVRTMLPPEWNDATTPQGRIYNDAVESLTVRLEKLFLRERPEGTEGWGRPKAVSNGS